MLELIRSWLIGVTCAAMIAALADGLTPPGTIQRIGKLTAGLVLLLAVLRPVLALDRMALNRALTEFHLNLSAYSQSLETENRELIESIIQEKTEAYIKDKAQSMGIHCNPAVEVSHDGELPVPVGIVISGQMNPEQERRLTKQIETDFAIPREKQQYRREGVENSDGA